jgi:DNA-binding NarL/FixJ family response regulator
MTEPKQPAAKIWLIEDYGPFRRAVSRLINQMDGLKCTGQFASCKDAFVALERGEQPDLILLDVGLPGISGIDAIPQLKQGAPGARLVILTAFEDDDKVFKAICAGASGYLLKSAPLEHVATAVREALAGGAPINARIASRVLDMFTRLAPAAADRRLTPKETEILQRLAEGLTTKEIASALGMNYHSVDAHLREIYDKLEVNTRSGAVAKALKEKLI